MSNEQNVNPLNEYYNDEYPKQPQSPPGLQKEMDPVPDCGEESYKGTGKLEGKRILVTGGDSGIGRAAAIAYAREGADVAIVYLPEEQPDADDVKSLIEAEGKKAVLIPGDLKSEEFSKEIVKKVVDELGGLDVLALVAGKQQSTSNIEDITTEQLTSTFETNVYSMFWTIQAAIPHLSEGASIITTTSIQGFSPSQNLLDYASTKFAIRGFTIALAKQLAPKGIRVNGIAPGPIWTALQISGGQPQEKIPEFGKETPLNRAGQPAELADMYVYLASAKSNYVTGEIIGITGGLPIA
ncbi:SDR family oxidoreductase [Marinilactibacillus piezotolerans]|uniref:SDR family oxidoreductase n=1 Tax=Marinilactibacillus piezotolerans TaxID=258723 RepID=UPI0009B07EF7|nr:SDR family oxidoreductase [Marinilactibacillus piezotolerans]